MAFLLTYLSVEKEYNKRTVIARALLIFLLTLLTRLLLLYFTSLTHQGDLSVLINIDEARYIREAGEILSGNTLPWDVPLYPMFLAVFFRIFGMSYLLASTLNIILFSLAVGILYLTIAYFFNEARALITVFTMIIYPTLLIDILYPAAEGLYLFLMSFLFYTFLNYLEYERKIYGALTAVILGTLTLTKETFIFFPIIVAAITFIKYFPNLKRPFKKIIFLITIYILMLLPLLIYNYRTYGKLSFSQKMIRVIGALPEDLATINKGGVIAAEKRSPIFSIKDFLWERKRFFLGTGTFGLMRALRYDTKKLELVADSPKDYFVVLREYGLGWRIFQYSALLFIISIFISSLFAMLVLLVKRRLKEAICFILIMFYFLAVYSSRYNSRYFIALVPFLALLSSYFYSLIYYYLRDKIKGKETGPI